MPTSNKVAIFTSVAKSGCATFEHHLDTVDGFLPNCSANHLPVFFFSTSTILRRFISSIAINLLNLTQRYLFYQK